jgi:hypothetical protein
MLGALRKLFARAPAPVALPAQVTQPAQVEASERGLRETHRQTPRGFLWEELTSITAKYKAWRAANAIAWTELLLYFLVAAATLAFRVPYSSPDWELVAIIISGVSCAIIFCLLAHAAMGKPPRTSQRADRPKYVSPYLVSCDETGISVMYEVGNNQGLKWTEISRIWVQIDEGFLPEPWWVLYGQDGRRCVFPLSARGQEKAITEFESRLDGFRSKASYIAISEAMGAMSGAFNIWVRPDAPQI